MGIKKYTIEEFLKAAEIGGAAMADAKYICSFLGKSKKLIRNGFDCKKCKQYILNQFDQGNCKIGYYLENGVDCGGIEFIKENSVGFQAAKRSEMIYFFVCNGFS